MADKKDRQISLRLSLEEYERMSVLLQFRARRGEPKQSVPTYIRELVLKDLAANAETIDAALAAFTAWDKINPQRETPASTADEVGTETEPAQKKSRA